jgi:histidine decarboxylase
MSKSNVRATPPTKDPDQVYPLVPGINFKDFELSSEGLPQEQINKALAELLNYESVQKASFLGYQANQKLDYDSDLHQYLNYHINNIGDPFQSGNFTVNSKFVERAVLDYFASLWNARWPHENDPQLPYEEWKDSYWGYVLSMGSSEGNVYGLWNARDYLSGKFLLEDPEVEHIAEEASKTGRAASVQRRLIYYQAYAAQDNPNEYSPVAFYSQDTHYSIIKFMRVLNISTFYEIAVDKKLPTPLKYPEDYPPNFSKQYIDQSNGWPFEVPSNEDGSIYIPALAKLVDKFAYWGYPPLVSFNYGTTFKGAFDNVKAAVDTLVPILQGYDLYKRKVYYDPNDKTKFDIRNGFWFHVDGALGAAYMPY